MIKRDLIVRISNETGITQREVKEVVQKSLDYIIEALERNETVELRNFGVFLVKQREPRIGRNPNNPEEIFHIPAKKVPDFKPGKIMRDRIEKSIIQ